MWPFKTNNNDIKELQEQVEKLELKVYRIENPFEFEIGDKAYYQYGNILVKIIKREWLSAKSWRDGKKFEYHYYYCIDEKDNFFDAYSNDLSKEPRNA